MMFFITVLSVLDPMLVRLQNEVNMKKVPVDIQGVVSTMFQSDDAFKPDNYPKFQNYHTAVQKYIGNKTDQLRRLQAQLQNGSLNFANFTQPSTTVKINRSQPLKTEEESKYYPGSDTSKFMRVSEGSDLYSVDFPTADPTEMFRAASAPPEQNEFENMNEEVLVVRTDGAAFVYPANVHQEPRDMTYQFMRYALAPVAKTNIFVDISAAISSQQRLATKQAAVIAMSALNPAGFINYYTVDREINLQYSGYINEVGVQLLIESNQTSTAENADGNMVYQFLIQQQATEPTVNIIFSPGFRFQANKEYKARTYVNNIIVNTQMYSGSLNEQVSSTVKGKIVNYITQSEKIKNAYALQYNLLLLSQTINCSLIDFSTLSSQNSSVSMQTYFRKVLLAVLSIHKLAEISLSEQMTTTKNLNYEMSHYLVAPIMRDQSLIGIVSVSLSLKKLFEKLTANDYIFQNANYFMIQNGSVLFEARVKSQQYGVYNFQLQPGQTIVTPIQLQKNSVQYGPLLSIINKERSMLSVHMKTNQIFLNNHSLADLQSKIDGYDMYEQLIPLYPKKTLFYDAQNKLLKKIIKDVGEIKYNINYKGNGLQSVLYVGSQYIVNQEFHKFITDPNLPQSVVMKLDNCTEFLTSYTFQQQLNRCLNYYDANLTLKIPLNMFQFFITVGTKKVDSNIILDSLQLQKKITIEELLGINTTTGHYIAIKNSIYSLYVSEELLYYVKLLRFTNFGYQINKEKNSPSTTFSTCVHAKLVGMFLCPSRFGSYVEIYDSLNFGIENYQSSNKHLLIDYNSSMFTNCTESWLTLIQQSNTPSSSFFFTPYYTNTKLGFSKFLPIQPYQFISPLILQLTQKSHLFFNQFTTKQDIDASFTSYTFIVDNAGYVIYKPEMPSQKPISLIYNLFAVSDNSICQIYGISIEMSRILFQAGLVELSYLGTSGRYCYRIELKIATATTFQINNSWFFVEPVTGTHFIQIKTNSSYYQQLFLNDIALQPCYPNLAQLNAEIKKFLPANYKKQEFDDDYEIGDAYDKEIMPKYVFNETSSYRIVVDLRVFNLLIWILTAVTIIIIVDRYSDWKA